METIGTPTLWVVFTVLVVAMLAIDLGVFHRGEPKEMSLKEALYRSIAWIVLSGLFNAGLYFTAGAEKGLEFTAGYLLEKALSVDNLFVFVVIFSAFKVPSSLQHRVLFWGIVGAVVLRGIFIGVGTALIQRFDWIIYIFGAILIWTSVKLFKGGEDDIDPGENPAFRLFKRFVPTVAGFRGNHFLVKENGKLFATPLLAVLVLVETSDVLFALDSIPAVFGVTQDPFIVYTSNIFAILGLRALYFLLAGVVHKFVYLKIGLALILGFVGLKMMAHGFIKVPIFLSLGVIAALLVGTIVASMLWPPAPKATGHEDSA